MAGLIISTCPRIHSLVVAVVYVFMQTEITSAQLVFFLYLVNVSKFKRTKIKLRVYSHKQKKHNIRTNRRKNLFVDEMIKIRNICTYVLLNKS